MHKAWVPHAEKFLGVDFEPGADVDVVADIHELWNAFVEQSLPMADIVISCSTFEHIRNPFKAASNIADVMKSGAIIFVQTHQTFPLHAYPDDFWRFSTESLSAVFQDAGVDVLDCAYLFPCKIESVQDPATNRYPAFLNVCLIGRKP
jgi:hypothetical protein